MLRSISTTNLCLIATKIKPRGTRAGPDPHRERVSDFLRNRQGAWKLLAPSDIKSAGDQRLPLSLTPFCFHSLRCSAPRPAVPVNRRRFSQLNPHLTGASRSRSGSRAKMRGVFHTSICTENVLYSTDSWLLFIKKVQGLENYWS